MTLHVSVPESHTLLPTSPEKGPVARGGLGTHVTVKRECGRTHLLLSPAKKGYIVCREFKSNKVKISLHLVSLCIGKFNVVIKGPPH